MSDVDNGGPAFPLPLVKLDSGDAVTGQAYGYDCGMSLRDYFAAAAMSICYSHVTTLGARGKGWSRYWRTRWPTRC